MHLLWVAPILYCICFSPEEFVHSEREPLQLLFPLERDSSLSHLSTPVAFQHLWPGSPNGAVGYPDWLGIQISEHAAPILGGFAHCRPVLARNG
ncbi:hypothetical protein AVEN_272763-1 [Araneus ventricosus]|uniref:Secreted protein n=1 Tax=Araneus ventricosus TaxID=182803 RepID=A0A4Y2BWM0_ARAVE|nr:hypothetical protein AVEN_272763-1 [Araneus ventricosus]